VTSAPPEPKLPHKNPGVEKPDGFFVKKSCIIRKSVNPHFGALLDFRMTSGRLQVDFRMTSG